MPPSNATQTRTVHRAPLPGQAGRSVQSFAAWGRGRAGTPGFIGRYDFDIVTDQIYEMYGRGKVTKRYLAFAGGAHRATGGSVLASQKGAFAWAR